MGLRLIIVGALALGLSGCAAIPEIRKEPTVHNPFPQLHKVAILPFFNLSANPTVNQDEMALAYYNELQQIPGFEVVPPGVVRRFLEARNITIDQSTDFQQLAREMGVDALVRGAITEFTPYYPPRIGISVDWFAANPSFHPIPPGYGLPWGTSEEEYIPDSLVFEAEFALAREQLDTQSPLHPEENQSSLPSAQAAYQEELPLPLDADGRPLSPELLADDLPPDWPDPRGFIPRPPSPVRPESLPQRRPVMTHTKLYDSTNQEFTSRLERYFFFREDGRFGGWQAYLQRSDDFIRFCCYLHITETLTARGGAGKTRVVWRWPIGRYVP